MDGVKPLSKSVRNSLRTGVILFDLTRVVEELVFNSLDSGATKVSIFLGIGTCYVKVVDNGSGISRDGLVLLGERYVTSKRRQISNGDTGYQSFGFRGEALASISDVSLLEIVTKIFGRPNGYRKVIKGSKCLYLGIDDVGKDVGTTVVVRDLFYNQPVRRKYLQSSPKKVLHLVRKCVLRIALVHPHVSFRVVDTEREQEILCTRPSSMLSLLVSSFGMEDDGNLQALDVSDGLLKLSGFVSCPRNKVSKKAFQYVYVNSLFVHKGPIHKLLNHLANRFSCVDDTQRVNNSCKRKRSRSHSCPTYVVNLRCPSALCDFSFEPSKTHVQFKDWIPILGFIEKAVEQHWGQLIACGQAKSPTCEADTILRDDDLWKEEIAMPSFVQDMLPECRTSIPPYYPSSSSFCFQSSCDTFSDETDTLVPTLHSYSYVNHARNLSDGGAFAGSLESPFLQNRFSSRSSSRDPFAIEDGFEFLTDGLKIRSDVIDGYDDFDLAHGDSPKPLSLRGNACSGDLDFRSRSFQPACWRDEHFLSDVDYESPELDSRFSRDESLEFGFNSRVADCQLFESQETCNDELCFGHTVACGGDPGGFLFDLSSGDRSTRCRDVERERIPMEQSGRRHSAPPFCKKKKTFICLTQSSLMKTEKLSSQIFADGPNSPAQMDEMKDPSFQLNRAENFASDSNMQNDENFERSIVSQAGDFQIEDKLTTLVDAGSKWRLGYHQTANNGACDPGNCYRILDLSMGFLHPTGGPLVPKNLKRICLRNAKVLPQVDKKFIPVVAGGVLSVIDQHAADERIRLEELREKVLSGQARSVTYLDAEQELALPEMHYQLLHNYSNQVRYWGWICNIQQGNFQKNLNILHCKAPVVSLIAVPCILGVNLTDEDLVEFLQQLVDTDGCSTIPPSVHHVLNVKACRGAIMFGDALLPSECGLIVEELGKTSLCFQCAHGRPTTVPLVCLEELHNQVAKLRCEEDDSAGLLWHGLSRQEISLKRATHRLNVATR